MRKRSTSIVMLAVVLWSAASPLSNACTNVMVTKGASKDGSTFVSYSADSHVLYGELYFWPARKHQPNALLDVREWDSGKYLGQIPQVAETYQVTGNMNEYQLTIAETTFGGRELADSTGIIDYGSLIYITLQRAKNAREAISVMAQLVAEFGYYSSGESFSIADPNEVWIMEMIGKGTEMVWNKKTKESVNKQKGAVWVAIRIPDGAVSAHANQARITTFPKENLKNSISSKNLHLIYQPEVEVVYQADVVSFATEKKFFTGTHEEFSFSDVYAPLDFGAKRFCEARVWSAFNLVSNQMDEYLDYAKGHADNRMPLFVFPSKKLSHRDVAEIMRDHYENTDLDMTKDAGAGPYSVPYRWRPMTYNVDGQTYFNERAIATQQTGFWFVAQMRSHLPNPIGGILWFGVDDAASSVLVPMYCGIQSIPFEFAQGNGDMLTFSWNSAFWVFNWVANTAYHRYQLMNNDIQKLQKELEDQLNAYVVGVDQLATEMYAKDPEAARQFLTQFSTSQTQYVVNRWRQLGEFLMVKYLDGNLHPEENGQFLRNPHGNPASPKHPGYSPGYYRTVVKDAGERLKVPGTPTTH